LNLLLDTHVLLWWMAAAPELGPTTALRIADASSNVWVSAATAWEIAIKAGLGRLDLGEPPEICLPRELARGGFRPLPVTNEHALAVRTLPPVHSDPFDRMLVAQARLNSLTLVTADAALLRYDCDTMDARR
jgi:PIN domain nuclease of toxin-antitoxin system